MSNKKNYLTPGQRNEMARGKYQMFVPSEVLGLASLTPEHYNSEKHPGIQGLHLESHSGVNSATATNGVILAQVCWKQLPAGDTDFPPVSVSRDIVQAVEIDGACEAAFTVQRVETGLLVDHCGEVRSIGKVAAVRQFVNLGEFPQNAEIFEGHLNENATAGDAKRVFISLHRLRQALDAIEDLAAAGMDELDTIEISIRNENAPLMLLTAKADMLARVIISPLNPDGEYGAGTEFGIWPSPRVPGQSSTISKMPA